VGSDSGKGSNIIRITPQSEFATGNLSVRLLTLDTPVIMTLETSREIVHYRFDAVIPEYGPMAKPPVIDQGITISAGDPEIASVLQGAVPANAQKLKVAGVDGRTTAYKQGGTTFVRTPLTLLSPGWSSSVASADGMRVYAIKDSPILLLSDRGKMVRARLSERDSFLEDAKKDDR
jgi:intracellular multiplication protein IcmK